MSVKEQRRQRFLQAFASKVLLPHQIQNTNAVALTGWTNGWDDAIFGVQAFIEHHGKAHASNPEDKGCSMACLVSHIRKEFS